MLSRLCNFYFISHTGLLGLILPVCQGAQQHYCILNLGCETKMGPEQYHLHLLTLS